MNEKPSKLLCAKKVVEPPLKTVQFSFESIMQISSTYAMFMCSMSFECYFTWILNRFCTKTSWLFERSIREWRNMSDDNKEKRSSSSTSFRKAFKLKHASFAQSNMCTEKKVTSINSSASTVKTVFFLWGSLQTHAHHARRQWEKKCTSSDCSRQQQSYE